eukprot:c1023_g1_i2.p1 GENE.c1023_g1_i2~~c1023_g1_i2.p1  ORF type:complete len:198 (+),score=23.15 c1023_g1_i2:275-868(+)
MGVSLPVSRSLLTAFGQINSNDRRVCNFGGRPGSIEVTEPLPEVFEKIISRMLRSGVYTSDNQPNHVLVNEYQDGAGISPHTDGPLYFKRVAVLTLAGNALLDFRPAPNMDDPQHDTSVFSSIFLMPRSLHVVSNSLYDCHHGIASVDSDLIPPDCLNLFALPNLTASQMVPRAKRRLSVVFVHKLGAQIQYNEKIN